MGRNKFKNISIYLLLFLNNSYKMTYFLEYELFQCIRNDTHLTLPKHMFPLVIL